jgi:hypothetical protein
MLNDLRAAGNALRSDALGLSLRTRYSFSEIASAHTLAALSCSESDGREVRKGIALSQETVPHLPMLLILSRVLNRNRGQAVENLTQYGLKLIDRLYGGGYCEQRRILPATSRHV